MISNSHPDLGEMPEHWKVAELGLVSDVTKLAGYEFTKHFEYIEEGEIIALRSLNVVDGQLDTTNVRRIARSVSEVLPRSKLFRNDLLLTYTGSKLGDTALVDLDDKYHLAPNVCRLRANDEGDAYFLYVFLRSKVFADLLDGYKVGSGQPTVPMKNIRKIPLPWPPRQEREGIGQVFRSLNDKIEVNRQTNQTLEEMAQAVFKSWFVDFAPTRAKMKAKENDQDPTRAAMAAVAGKTVEQLDTLSPEQLKTLTTTAALFPDTMVETDLGEIPEDWEAKPLYETAEYVNGAAFKAVDFCNRKEGLPIIKIAELKQGIYDGTKYTLKEVKQRHFITNDDVLYSWSGSPETSLEVFKWFGGDGWLNQHIFKLNFASDVQKYFTYYLLKHMKPVLIGIARDKQTTGLGHVTVADMKRLLVPYPDNAVLQSFMQIIAPMYEQCSIIEKENITLSEVRDALLPKLLSGEIGVNSEVAQ